MIPLPVVRRVETATGSHIEPRLEDRWTDDQKIAWKAAVVGVDSGMTVNVKRSQDGYTVMLPRTYIGGPCRFNEAWHVLNVVSRIAESLAAATEIATSPARRSE